MTLEFRLLGSTEIVHNGQTLPALAGKQRTVLAALLLRPGRAVSTTELTAQVWEQAPRNPRNALQTYIRRLRALLPEPVLRTTATGYLAEVPADSVDLHRFRALVAGAAGDPRAERATLRAALALWRGPALSDVFSPALRLAVTEVEAERRRALERRIDLDLALGAPADLVVELQQLTAQDPLNERHWGQLVLALARTGRQAEALHTFQRASESLAELLGTRPGAELLALHQAILTESLPSTVPPPPPPRESLPIHQLPLDINDFVGRAELLSALTTGPPGCTVVYGQPGVGKTALAVHAGHLLKDRYPDGQLYVDLRGYSPGEKPTPFSVLARFLRAFGLAESEIPPEETARAELYQSLLADRRFLVLLDNAADAATVAPLIPAGKHCRTLITSRGVMPGLPKSRRVTLDVLSPAEARTLLRQTLGHALVESRPAEADRLAELCARLPLALRVAAANLAGLDAQELTGYLQRLTERDRLAELSIEDDQATAVRRAFELSYRALPEPARRMFRLLSVAPGADVAAAAAIALAGPQAPAALGELVDAHLADEYRPGRYRCHDLLRLYAAERHQAEDSPAERAQAERRLLEHCLTGAVQTAHHMYGPSTATSLDAWTPPPSELRLTSPTEALAWFNQEFPTLDQVQARATGNDPGLGALLGIALLRVLHVQFRHDERRPIAHRTTPAAERTGDARLLADTLVELSEVMLWQANHRASVRHAAGARLRYAALGLTESECMALIRLGHAHGLGRSLSRSCDYLERARHLAVRIGSKLAEGTAQVHLAEATRRMGRIEADLHLHQGHQLLAEIGAIGVHAFYLADIGSHHIALGQFSQAVRTMLRAERQQRNLGFTPPQWMFSGMLGEAYAELGDYANAQRCLEVLNTGPSPVHRRMSAAYARVVAGIAEHRRGEHRLAIGHFTAARELTAPLRQDVEQGHALIGLARAHLALGEAERAREHAELAVAHARQSQQRTFEARGLLLLARAEQRLGAHAAATEHARAALEAFQETGYEGGTGQTLALLTELDAARPDG